jgi:hypothetical protein
MSVPSGPPGGPPNLPDQNKLSCSSQACASAQAMVVDAANDIISTCGAISDANGRASALLGIAGGLFGVGAGIIGGLVTAIGIAATAALLVAVAISLNWLLFWVAVTLIATAILLLAVYVGILIYVAILQGQLGGKRQAFRDAATQVMQNCPSTCWGNLVMPSC